MLFGTYYMPRDRAHNHGLLLGTKGWKP